VCARLTWVVILWTIVYTSHTHTHITHTRTHTHTSMHTYIICGLPSADYLIIKLYYYNYTYIPIHIHTHIPHICQIYASKCVCAWKRDSIHACIHANKQTNKQTNKHTYLLQYMHTYIGYTTQQCARCKQHSHCCTYTHIHIHTDA
jgi:hypothetical protein